MTLKSFFTGYDPLWPACFLICIGGLVTGPAAQNSVVVWGSRSQVEVPIDATNLASVAVAADGCIGVGRNGSLYRWGWVGTLPASATNAFAAAVMTYKPIVLRRDGTVVSTTGVISGLSNAVAVAAATSYGAGALRQDGTFFGWDGLWSPNNATSNVVAIMSGNYATIDVLYSDGAVWASGIPQAFLSSLTNIVAMARGPSQVVWLKSDSTVAAYPASNPPAGLSNVVAVAGGGSHALALRADGTVATWGGNFDTTNVPPNLTNVVAIAAGRNHSLALRVDGTVIAWGQNNAGQINVPYGLTNVAAVFAYGDYNVALVGATPPALLSQLPDETVWSGQPATFTLNAVGSPPLRFQWQHDGEIIPGATNSFLRIDQATAADAGLYNLIVSNARGTAASRECRLNVRANPFFLTQPTNQSTVFGGSTTLRVAVSSPTTPSYQWYRDGSLLAGATDAVLSLGDTAAADIGDYWCVVSNSYSQITSSVARILVVLPVAPTNQLGWLGGTVTFAISSASTKPVSWQWYNENGLVSGATDSVLTLTNLSLDHSGSYWAIATSSFGSCTSAPVRLSVNGLAAWGEDYGYGLPTNLSSVTALGTGWYHFFAKRGDGTPFMWGLNDNGAGGTSPASLPEGLSNIVALAGGAGHSLALLSDGTVRVWGRSSFGVTNIPDGLINIVAVAAGTYHCMVLGNDGRVRAWGGAYVTLEVPDGLDHVVSISSRADHMLALRADGTVVAWGEDVSGETRVPPGLRDVVAVAAGSSHSVALRADGTVVVWGANSFGQTNVPPGLSNVIAVAAGFNHTLALRSDGTVISWGYQTNVPSGLSHVVAIAASGNSSLAIVEPGLAAPAFQIADPVRALDAFSLQVPTSRAKRYYLQYRDSLAESWWTPLPPIPGDGGIKILSDPQAAVPERFYRVWQQP